MNKSEYGKNGFFWFFAIVENRLDPLNMGRVQIRCLGWHGADLSQIPVEHLPWANVLMPANSASVSGIGQSPTGLVEGSSVFGFFMDGIDAQMPVIICSAPGIPLVGHDTQKGFVDNRKSVAGFPKNILSNKAENYPIYLDEPDNNRLARNETIDETINHLKSAPESISTASHTSSGLGGDGSQAAISLTQPAQAYQAKYPYNHVKQSESGHVFEMDDTLGHERLHIFHRIGTFYEIQPDGTVSSVIKGNEYALKQHDSVEHVVGKKHIFADDGATIKVNGLTIQITGRNYNLDVNSGSANLNISGDINIKVGGNRNESISGNSNITIGGSETKTISGTLSENIRWWSDSDNSNDNSC